MRISSTVVRSRALVVVLLLALLGAGMTTAVLQAPPAKAYAFLGPIWANQPSPGNCCAHLYVVVYPYIQNYDITGWNDGMNAWTDSPAYILYSNGTQSTIVADDAYDSSIDADGWTDWHALFGHFTDAHGYLNYYDTQHMSRPAIQAVAAHEMGHVAGLAGVSTSCVLMNDWQDLWPDCGLNIPVDDDIQGINALY